MKITVIERQTDVREDMKTLIETKIEKLGKYFADDASAVATLSHKHNDAILEVTITSEGILYRSEVNADNYRSAMDEASDNIIRQIHKNKTRLSRNLRDGVTALPEFEDADEEKEFDIRVKKFPVKPMTSEEAILQMNLLGHSFFVFRDAEVGDVCTVYVRHDGTYGMIVPEV